jgi:hypothetical protein
VISVDIDKVNVFGEIRYEVVIRGIEPAKGYIVGHHEPYDVAVRIRDRVIAELIAYNGPEAPQPDRTVLEHLDNINANFDQAQAK